MFNVLEKNTITSSCQGCSNEIEVKEDTVLNFMQSNSADSLLEMLCPQCQEEYEEKMNARMEFNTEEFFEY